MLNWNRLCLCHPLRNYPIHWLIVPNVKKVKIVTYLGSLSSIKTLHCFLTMFVRSPKTTLFSYNIHYLLKIILLLQFFICIYLINTKKCENVSTFFRLVIKSGNVLKHGSTSYYKIPMYYNCPKINEHLIKGRLLVTCRHNHYTTRKKYRFNKV